MLLADGDMQNFTGALPPVVQWIIAIAVGATSVGVPLYAKIRRMSQDIRSGEIEIDGKEVDLKAQERVNADEEFKRILKYRDDEINRLHTTVDEQAKEIRGLFAAHLECAKNEARQDERSKMNTEKIQGLERKVMMLEMLLHEKGTPSPANVTINTTGTPAVKVDEPPATPPTPALIVPAS